VHDTITLSLNQVIEAYKNLPSISPKWVMHGLYPEFYLIY
jgi:hypothetical protein